MTSATICVYMHLYTYIHTRNWAGPRDEEEMLPRLLGAAHGRPPRRICERQMLDTDSAGPNSRPAEQRVWTPSDVLKNLHTSFCVHIHDIVLLVDS